MGSRWAGLMHVLLALQWIHKIPEVDSPTSFLVSDTLSSFTLLEHDRTPDL